MMDVYIHNGRTATIYDMTETDAFNASVSDCRQRSNFKMRGWTFSMHKMKLNVEIPMIRAANMI